MNSESHFTVARNDRAFTFVELLVVLAVLALLAVMILPAMAGVQHKSGRTQCAANLRQVFIGSMLYANDYNTWLPPARIGANPTNILNAQFYTRYLWIGPALTQVPASYTASTALGGQFQNQGYLHGGNYGNDAKVFFCPAQYGTALGENSYSPLLRSDPSGAVRSSYYFNPRVINPAIGNNLRRYQKTSQLPSHKLFTVDYLDVSSLFAHQREGGWNVLFTDGTVKFSQNTNAYALIKATAGNLSMTQAEQAYDYLELEH